MKTLDKFLFVFGVFIVLCVAYSIITHQEVPPQAEYSTNCDFTTVLTNRTLHLQPNGVEILPYKLLLPYRERAKSICIINMKGNPVEVEAYRDEGDGKTFQADHLELEKVLLTSGGANTASILNPSGAVGLIVKITNPYNFTSDVQIMVTGLKN